MKIQAFPTIIILLSLTKNNSSDWTVDKRNQRVQVNINTDKDSDNHWKTTFNAVRNSSVFDGKVELDVGHEINECNGRQIVKVFGVFKDHPPKEKKKILLHPRASPNAIVLNDGLALITKSSNKYASALTNSILRDDEPFEVTLNLKSDKHSNPLSIGVTKLSPFNVNVTDDIFDSGGRTWMFMDNNVLKNGFLIKTNYFSNLDMKTGDRLGVVRKHNGALHFLYNGKENGRVAMNVPPVYGVVQLLEGAILITVN